MTVGFNQKRTAGLVFPTLYLIFLASIIFSFRAVSSISIAAILAMAIFFNPRSLRTIFQRSPLNCFLFCCTLLFLLHVIAMRYTNDQANGWANLRIKSGLVVIPLAVCLSSCITRTTLKKLLSRYCLLLALMAAYCMLFALIAYQKSGNSSVFFYHSLVKPFSQHAVYVSILVITGLIFLFENWPANGRSEPVFLNGFLVVLLSVFLFLLSSRLVLSFYLAYLLFFLFTSLRKKKPGLLIPAGFLLLIVLAIAGILFSRNPVSKRFHEIVKGDIKMINRQSFAKSDYFNGLQFRLLQWKLVPEILSEKNRWWMGVSPGDAQHLLNEKYLARNMYAGENDGERRGYLLYNTHNQFLQTILQTGITGLVVLLAICLSLIVIAWQLKNRMLSTLVLLLLFWLFTEAAFETQYGILLFTFFPLFLAVAGKNSLSGKGQPFER